MMIDELGLRDGTRRLLAGAGIETVEELVTWDAAALLKIRQLGGNRLGEIKQCLKNHGLALGSKPQDVARNNERHKSMTFILNDRDRNFIIRCAEHNGVTVHRIIEHGISLLRKEAH